MLREKKKHKGTFHALSIGETQGKEVCYRRHYGKKGKGKKKGNTRHNTQNQPTNPPKTCTGSLSTGEESTVGRMERYVFRVTQTTHFCYTSTGPLLLVFFFCVLNTTMPTDDEDQPRYDTPHQPHTASTHMHTHGSHIAHDPTTRPKPTRSATARPLRTATHTTNTHNKGHPHPRNTPPQPAGPSQEWRGAAHHHCRRTPARSGGEPHPGPSARSGEERPPPPAAKPGQEWRGDAHGNLRQEWRGTNYTTHQPQPHQHTTPHHTARQQHTTLAHTRTHTNTRGRRAHAHTTTNTDTRNTHHTHQHRHRTHTPRHEHTQHGKPPPAERPTAAAGGPQPGVAGSRPRDPQPGVARNAHHHQQRNPARSGGE